LSRGALKSTLKYVLFPKVWGVFGSEIRSFKSKGVGLITAISDIAIFKGIKGAIATAMFVIGPRVAKMLVSSQ
jgi:hypothetical protein